MRGGVNLNSYSFDWLSYKEFQEEKAFSSESPEELKEATESSECQAGGGGTAGVQQQQVAQVSTSAALTPWTEQHVLSARIHHLSTTHISGASSCRSGGCRLGSIQQGCPHKGSITICWDDVRTAQESL